LTLETPCASGIAIYTFSQVTGIRAGGLWLCKVPDPKHHPFVVEDNGMIATKIFFESEEARHACLMALPDDPSRYAKGGLLKHFDYALFDATH